MERFLFIGLGNPGVKYANTRHNIGFMVVNSITNSINPTPINKPQFRGELYKKNNLFLLKPQTFMNLSGESLLIVKNYFNYSKIKKVKSRGFSLDLTLKLYNLLTFNPATPSQPSPPTDSHTPTHYHTS